MTLRKPQPLLLVAAAFVAALALFWALNGGGGASVAPGGSPDAGSGGGHLARTTDQQIAALQAVVRTHPTDPDERAALADAYLQKVRETGDFSYYQRAQGVLAGARRNASVLTELGTLALARHDFRAGLSSGLAAHRAEPTQVKPLGVIVDAQVELGRYGAAGRTLQRMVDEKPNLSSYARVSYFRELHGDLAGATRAMGLAVDAGGSAPENVAYVQSLLGQLEFTRGRLRAAADAYREALYRFPAYPAAGAGLARVEAARGRLGPAIRRLRGVVARLPLPEYVVALGETELAAGMRAQGRRDLELVRAEERLLHASGVNTDTELALFEADHGSPARGVALARRAWRRAPSVRSADSLGWSLTRAGDARAGLGWARRALRLGSRDPMFLYHAGIAALRAGDTVEAHAWLRRALALNPRFNPLHALRARRALEALR
jgi:tetratricopeptide (TPR) repeat protein